MQNVWDQVYWHMQAHAQYQQQAYDNLKRSDATVTRKEDIKISMTTPCYACPPKTFYKQDEGKCFDLPKTSQWDFLLACAKTTGCAETIGNICYHTYDSNEQLCGDGDKTKCASRVTAPVAGLVHMADFFNSNFGFDIKGYVIHETAHLSHFHPGFSNDGDTEGLGPDSDIHQATFLSNAVATLLDGEYPG